ncbi:MAG TPA: alpha/beta hydrolase [Verrucomicrobiae bacterium]|nr:alpha/beta hydrolase [Verrucomicrobiae bacterium]
MEDWNTLKVPSGFRYADPMPPLRGEFPEFTREIVQLTWRPWDIIDLYVMKPKGVKKPPVILYLYSFPSDTDRFRDNEFAQVVTKNGFAAVGFVSALTGSRYHDRPMREWFVSDLQEALGSTVHDVQLILSYLASRGDLDMTRVGMFAEGSGASIAIMAASVDPRIRALDLFEPWGDWPDWLAHSALIQSDDERANYLKPEFLKRVENLDPVKYLPQLKNQKVRVQFLEDDKITPKAARERLEAVLPPDAASVRYQDSRDFLKTVQTTDNMFNWLQEQVVAPAANAEKEPATGTPSSAVKASNQ